MADCTEEISPDVISTLVQGVYVNVASSAWVASLDISRSDSEEGSEMVSTITPINRTELTEAQRADATISRVLYYLQDGRKPSKKEHKGESTETLILLRDWAKLKIENGLLYRYTQQGRGV